LGVSKASEIVFGDGPIKEARCKKNKNKLAVINLVAGGVSEVLGFRL
jgi:hypothetical protein